LAGALRAGAGGARPRRHQVAVHLCGWVVVRSGCDVAAREHVGDAGALTRDDGVAAGRRAPAWRRRPGLAMVVGGLLGVIGRRGRLGERVERPLAGVGEGVEALLGARR
jgi:hypothetical protein